MKPAKQSVLLYLPLPASLVFISLAGYTGYLLYPRFDLSPATGIGLMALSSAAGIASFFSPCSFPLLVTLLSASAEDSLPEARPGGPWRFAAGMAVGACLFLAGMGAVIAVGGDAVFAGITFTSPAGRLVRVGAGTLLLLLGLMQLNLVRGPEFHRIEASTVEVLDRILPARLPAGSMRRSAAYGFGYVLTGIG